MNTIDKFNNWRRKQRWNKQYKNGRWASLRNNKELGRYAAIIGYMNILSPKENPAILDLGCGEGILNERLSFIDYEYFLGIDYAKSSIDQANEKSLPNSEYLCADLHQYTPDRKFDIIVFNEVFYYLHDSVRTEVLNKMIDALNPDGIIICSIYREAPHCWAYFNEALEQLTFNTIKTEEETRFWQVGAYKKATN